MSRFWARLKLNLDLYFPLTLAIFAAILAMNDLFAGRYGADELELSNSRNNAYQWFQSKGIKETALESQQDLLRSLLLAGVIDAEKRAAVEAQLVEGDRRIDRYKKEKKEILLGSAALPKEQWIQDVDGELGKVKGAKELERQLGILGEAGDFFDLASMLLQIALVLGAVGLMLGRESYKFNFFRLTISLGLCGFLAFGQALWQASGGST